MMAEPLYGIMNGERDPDSVLYPLFVALSGKITEAGFFMAGAAKGSVLN